MYRDEIKLIAIILMALSHFAKFIIPFSSLSPLFLSLGTFTAPVMCYFLSEGYAYTKSKRNYALRLLLFAILSEPAFHLLHPRGFNMLFTLFFSFLLLFVNENVKNIFLRIILSILLIFLCAFCDWSVYAPLLTLLIYKSENDRKISALIMLFLSIIISLSEKSFEGAGIALAAFFICFLYNGKKREGLKSKYFFYLFYPLHLYIIVFLFYFIY